jgi:hypothetical protein
MSSVSPSIHELVARGDDTVMCAGDVVQEMTGHPDFDVTIAIGATLVDVYAVQYDGERDRIILRVLPEDLADAVAKLARDGLALGQVAGRATGKGRS